MDMQRRHILLGVGLSSMYIIWYAYRKWSQFQCPCRFCQPKNHITHGFLIDSYDEWFRCQEKVMDKIDSAKFMAIDCQLSGGVPQRQRVALLAFSTSTDRITFVRLSQLGEVPDELAAALRDPSIIKVGVEILEHAALLEEEFNVEMNGCLDLRYMAMATPAVKAKLIRARSDLSLPSMARNLLGLCLAEDDKMHRSDWEAARLSNAQIYYVSGLAISAFELAVEIASANGVVSRLISFLLKPYLWLEHFVSNQYATYIDIPFRRERMARHIPLAKPPPAPPTDKAMKSYKTLKAPLYDNCVLLCPDSEQLCTCDKRKAQWYLDNGLGEKVSDNPLTVRLTFEPAQRAILDGQYYCLSKQNICVVCGSSSSLVRKYVVPREYRKHFPKIMKHHNAHDIVLTCLRCHSRSCWFDDLLRQELADVCDAARRRASTTKFAENETLKSVRSAANALRKYGDQLPVDRRRELEETLKRHFNVAELSDAIVDSAARIDYRVPNASYVSHGEKVVEHFSKHEGLLAFEKMWREFFLTEMKPAFLPELWSKNHHHDVIAVKLSFIGEANPDEAQNLMRILGITPQAVVDILTRLKEEDNVNFSRLNFQKGRLLETLPTESA